MTEPKKPAALNRRRFAAVLTASTAAAPALLAAQQTSPQQGPAGAQPPGPAGAAPNPITSAQLEQRRFTPPPEPPAPFDDPLEFTKQAARAKVEPFPMTQVRLLAGPFHDAQEWNRGYMARLDVPRLLYNFRQNAGLDTGTVANPFGGWEAPADGKRGTELRGHFTGHFLSASAQLYASTGDKDAKAKGDELVDGLAKCQAKLGGGYLSAFPMELFDRLDALSGQPNRGPGGPQLPWAPFYTIHKIMAGLFDMYRLTDNQQALKVVEGMAGWADGWTASKSPEHMQQILNTEYGGMAEVLYNLSAATNNDRWARAGDRYTKKWFFNPLAQHRDSLNRDPNGRAIHVNTHIPQVIGAARRYEISSDARFHEVARFFWDAVVTGHSYVTMGTSNGESWQQPAGRIAAELKMYESTAECCCAYNMLKLTRHLYSWDPQPRYFDYYERSMLNHRLGTILPDKGYTQYYLSLYPGAYKTFCNEDHCFWCCTGTGVEEYSKAGDSIYWRDAEGIYVNLFIPSELDWAEKGFKLRQENQFPERQETALVITESKPVKMALRLRIPGWLKSEPTVKLNGRAIEASAAPGSYLTLSRVWKKGDRVELQLPMQLTMEATPDNPRLQAFLYGPLVLAGDLGSDGLTERMLIGPSSPRVRPPRNPQQQNANTPPFTPVEVPTFHAAVDADPASWIKPADKPLTFHTAGQTKDVAMAPLNSIFGKRYSVYWEVA
jgi:uncharacterized protein